MSEFAIDPVSRRALDRLQNLGKTDGPFISYQWVECNVNMVGHHNKGQEFEVDPIPTETHFQNDPACIRGKLPPSMRAKRDELDFEIWLVVRQPAAVFVFAKHD